MINHTELLEIIDYNKETGIFIWIKPRPKVRVGQQAGYKNKKGRVEIEIFGKVYQAPRLAVFYMTGNWPENQVDHINCIRDDNRWDNLRVATQSQNQANRPARKNKKVPYKGVSLKSHLPKPYVAQICKDGNNIHLGCFSTPEQAHVAYCKAAKELHGKYWRG